MHPDNLTVSRTQQQRKIRTNPRARAEEQLRLLLAGIPARCVLDSSQLQEVSRAIQSAKGKAR